MRAFSDAATTPLRRGSLASRGRPKPALPHAPAQCEAGSGALPPEGRQRSRWGVAVGKGSRSLPAGGGGMEVLPSPLESARFIAGRSRDVSVDEEGARKVAESLFDKASEEAFGLSGWKALHELNPRAASEEAVSWVFLVDTLNFSFWSDSAEQKCLVRYKGKAYSGYWALCAAVNRALDDGQCGRGAPWVGGCPGGKGSPRSRINGFGVAAVSALCLRVFEEAAPSCEPSRLAPWV